MTLIQIVNALGQHPLQAHQPQQLAKAAILCWMLNLSRDTNPHLAAISALKRCAQAPKHPVVQEFVNLLEEIAITPTATPKRRGGRRKLLVH